MTKEQVIRGCVALIRKVAEERGLEVKDLGEGHGFDGGFWQGILKDESHIPNVIAKGEGYSIELRSFWGSPEIDVRRMTKRGEELLIFNFSDSVKNFGTGQYDHTEEWHVHEVRVDAIWDYRKCIREVYRMIDFVLKHGKEA